MDGAVDSAAMTFFDGAGPNGADLVLGGYHWPKGVQGMDRHTGEVFWAGNPQGGEGIGTYTPVFSNDGSTIYVVNDATESPDLPAGHPLMAFSAETGPSTFWHNGGDPNNARVNVGSVIVAPDGRIFGQCWGYWPVGEMDSGTSIAQTWVAATESPAVLSTLALDVTSGLRVVSTNGYGQIKSYDGTTGQERWAVETYGFMQSAPTVDPANGHIYVAGGADDVIIMGLDRNGQSLWGTPYKQVFDYQYGVNNAQRALGGGALSFDGQTYYFQTVSLEGDGRLYAINTADGSLKWSFETHSQGCRFLRLVAHRHPRRRGDRREQRRRYVLRDPRRGEPGCADRFPDGRLGRLGAGQRDAVSRWIAVSAAAHRPSRRRRRRTAADLPSGEPVHRHRRDGRRNACRCTRRLDNGRSRRIMPCRSSGNRFPFRRTTSATTRSIAARHRSLPSPG